MSSRIEQQEPKHNAHNDNVAEFARRLSGEHINDGGKGDADAKAATTYVQSAIDTHKMVASGAVPSLEIVGGSSGGGKPGSLMGRDHDGHYWNISQDKKGLLHAKSAEPADPESKSGPSSVANPGNGWSDHYNAKHGRLTAEQAAAQRGEQPPTAPKKAGSDDKPTADGSGLYSADGGKGGAWTATKNALMEQSKQRGIKDYNPSNTDIANAQQSFAAENGFHGKHAVRDWAKSLKSGELFDTPAADLRGAGFQKGIKESAGENPELNKAKAEPMKGGDSRLTIDGKLKTNDVDNFLHAVGGWAGYDPRGSFKSSVETEQGTGAVKRTTTAFTKPQTMGELYNHDGTRHADVSNVEAQEYTRGLGGRRNFTFYGQPGHHTYGHIGKDGSRVVDKED